MLYVFRCSLHGADFEVLTELPRIFVTAGPWVAIVTPSDLKIAKVFSLYQTFRKNEYFTVSFR